MEKTPLAPGPSGGPSDNEGHTRGDSRINQQDNKFKGITTTPPVSDEALCDRDHESLPTPASSRCCSTPINWRKYLLKRLPVLAWFPKYSFKDQLLSDLIAGISVGLTVIPQSIAYAAIAGLSSEFGLYSSYVGCFLYIVFGSCRQVTIGPTAVLALLTFETCGAHFPACAVLTGFYSGVFELFMAVLHLGWIVSFISEPVVLGFTSGAAVTIISSQIKNFLGLEGPKGDGFVGYWSSILSNLNTLSIGDTVMGVSSFVALLLMKEVKDLKFLQGRSKPLKTVTWLITVSRNVIIVLLTTLTAYLWPSSASDPPFAVTGQVLAGFPPVSPPSFRLPFNTSTSEDPSSYLSVVDSFSSLGAGPFVIALIAILQNVAICKAFGAGQSVAADQEMLALGLSNAVGSFFSGFAICGSFSRSAVNNTSGVTSPLGGLFTGALILLSLGFLTPTFYYIPKSSLAAVIISAVMVMIEFKPLAVMWKINRMDLFSCLTTFFAAILFGMEYGIMIGVSCSLIGILVKGSKSPDLHPQLRLDPVSGVHFIYAKPDHGLSFPSVDHVRECLGDLVATWPEVSRIVLSFQGWNLRPDYTVVTAVASLSQGILDKELIFVDVSPKWRQAFQSAGYSTKDKKFPVCCSYSDLSTHFLAKEEERRRGSGCNQAVISIPVEIENSGPSHSQESGRSTTESKSLIEVESECEDCKGAGGGGDLEFPGNGEVSEKESSCEESNNLLLS